jgi:hypothetical protein
VRKAHERAEELLQREEVLRVRRRPISALQEVEAFDAT